MGNEFYPDLSFVKRYDNELAKFNSIRSATCRRINAGVVNAAQSFYEYEALELAQSDYEAIVPDLNDRILEQEGFTREQMESGSLPAYMENMIHTEDFDDVDHNDNIDKARMNLYESVYHVHDVLTPDTLDVLGDDYNAYYVAKRAEEEAARAAELKALRSQNGMKSTFVNPKTGETYLSLVDPSTGESTEDDYAFDEFD